MTLARRLLALEQRSGRSAGPCPGPVTIILPHNGRDPMPQDAPSCPHCGEHHVLIVEEITIGAEGG